MKIFKMKRENETYYRVELPAQFSPDGKRRSIIGRPERRRLIKSPRKRSDFVRVCSEKALSEPRKSSSRSF